MNSYCTASQLSYLYDLRILTELSADGSEILDMTRVDFCLDTAASEVDGALYGRYTLPMTNPPLLLTKLTAAIAMRALFGRRNDLPKGLQADVEWAQKWIDDMRRGLVAVPGVERMAGPVLSYSGAKDGSSRFDNLPLMDQSGNTPTSVSGGNRGVLG